MREILFRSKRLDDGKWLQGDLRQFKAGMYIESFRADGCKLNYVVDPKTVGQFTGLTDKNGTKIFEGDIVQFPDCITCSCGAGDYEFTSSIGVVDYDEDVMCFYFSNRYSVEMEDFDVKNGCMTEVEIIGNIHDNPELIGGADNEK